MIKCQGEHHQGHAEVVFFLGLGFYVKVLNWSGLWRVAKLIVKGEIPCYWSDALLVTVACHRLEEWEGEMYTGTAAGK